MKPSIYGEAENLKGMITKSTRELPAGQIQLGPICEDCGTSESVMNTTCPWSSEIHNNVVHVKICPNCYQQRTLEI